ncbi:efflux RND transporter periplasmic adaptor subunit [Glaciecola sp. XM2]|jgi:RND family efflux transporter MFP subunit|uniref:efflux RND transporter periplasmic adaptor subunit n=1 Tax=Glaciecola sp. XM2 TaxID=1914931 RepID=UPI001BDE5596|nr:efflux RND transporter periplasmic adaptor subunit [Glaciecola sp. XM2]MBT1451624.1 efflux RND transporter periplasmic adaptor subunit [Glaciecola sp. XM2]
MSGNFASHRKGLALMLLMSGACFVLLVMLMIFSGNSGGQAYAQEQLMVMQNAKIQVSKVVIQPNFERKRIVYGTIEASKQSDIGFDIAGVISSIAITEGQLVSQGQVLATLDTARLLAQQTELKAAVMRAQADARLAAVSNQRIKNLVAANLESQQLLDESKARVEAADAFVNEIKARLASLKVELDKSILRAPFDGQIVRLYTDEGTVLNNGQAVFSILAQDSLEARFGLPDNTGFAIAPGDEYELNMGEERFNARVKSVSRQRNLATRTLNALFSIDQSQLSPLQLRTLVSGNLVSISVGFEVDKRGVWIPVDALSSGVRGLWTVFTYDAQTQIIQPRSVAVEHLDGEYAFVSGALKEGELFVASGTHRLTPGQKAANVEQIDPVVMAQLQQIQRQ